MTLVTHPPLSTWRCISRVTLPASAPSSLLCCQRLAPVGEAWGLPELMMTLWVTLSHSGFSIRKVTCLSYGPPSLSLAFEITNMIPWSSYAYFFVLFLNYFRTWLLKRVIYWVSLLAHQQAILPTAPFFFFFFKPCGIPKQLPGDSAWKESLPLTQLSQPEYVCSSPNTSQGLNVPSPKLLAMNFEPHDSARFLDHPTTQKHYFQLPNSSQKKKNMVM